MASHIFFCLLLLFIVCVQCSCIDYGYSEKDVASEDSIRNLFEKWSVQYNKIYVSDSEKMLRYGIFKDKLQFIHAHNKQQPPPLYMLGLNEFSDISNSEFTSGMPRTEYKKNSKRPTMKDSLGDDDAVPTSIDWRNRGAVSSIKNVGNNCTGGSWAFATAGAVEAVNQIATGQLVDLSAQQLIDCETKYGNKGCVSGFPMYAFFYLQNTFGIYTDADYPFIGVNDTCKKKNAFVVSIDGYDNLWQSSDDSDIVKAVAVRPVTAVMDGSKQEFQSYKGGIYTGPCDNRTVSLSVLIVGYGSENGNDYWIIKNSWGTSWGENGYMRLQRGNHGLPLGRCAVNSFVWYPTKALALNMQNLVGWWKLDEISGSVAKDSSVSQANGKISGAYWEQGGGLTFNGNGVVSCGTKASLSGKIPFSVVAWVKIPSAVDNTAVIVQQRGPGGYLYNGEYQLYTGRGGKLSFWVYGDYATQFRVTASVSINDGKWHNIVAVRDGREGRLYVDGNLKASATGDVKNLKSTLPVYIGCDVKDEDKFFKGSIAGVKIYSRALSGDEIKALSSEAPTKCSVACCSAVGHLPSLQFRAAQ